MKIIIQASYDLLSKQAAADLAELMRQATRPLLCTASGDSPAGLYKEIVEMAENKNLDISRWQFLGLDEWLGMNGRDEGSCRYYLDRQLFGPLAIPESRISFFDGRAEDPAEECERQERFIREHGGIEVAILGLGLNGHIGMNEPGTAETSRSHIAVLDPITQQTGQKYFKKEKQLTKGLTLGIGTLMEARYIFLLVSGLHKAAITRQVLEEQVSPKVPASLLRHHPGLHIYLDSAAASLLQLPRA